MVDIVYTKEGLFDKEALLYAKKFSFFLAQVEILKKNILKKCDFCSSVLLAYNPNERCYTHIVLRFKNGKKLNSSMLEKGELSFLGNSKIEKDEKGYFSNIPNLKRVGLEDEYKNLPLPPSKKKLHRRIHLLVASELNLDPLSFFVRWSIENNSLTVSVTRITKIENNLLDWVDGSLK